MTDRPPPRILERLGMTLVVASAGSLELHPQHPEAPMRLAGRGLLSIVCAAINVMATAPMRAQAPCEQIRTACKNAGFVQGGPVGERLVLDCFNPLVLGEMPPKRVSRPLPQITPQLAAACKERTLARQSPGEKTRSWLPSIPADCPRGGSCRL